jgi:hypothetical protein
MGSWNDGGPTLPKDQAEYERVTGNLYAAVIRGLVLAVNEGLAR